jgi:D-3-phosphoglycerate dehydrogenase/C-terminal binding protein
MFDAGQASVGSSRCLGSQNPYLGVESEQFLQHGSRDMNKRKVVITDVLADELLPEREVLGDLAEIEAVEAEREEDLEGRVEDADALIVYHTIILSPKTIDRLERCRLIVRGGVGYDNVDCQYARIRGIPVANVPDYGTEEVADSTIGLVLALTRGFAFLNSRLRRSVGPWTHYPIVPLYRLRGQTLGIVGLGRIGTAVAIRAKALGMGVVFYDPYKPRGYDKALGISQAETLEELASRVRVLSLHCPLSDETRNMIDARVLQQLPEGAYLVNTARGAVVDTAAIPGALLSGRLAGAALDVLDQEPPSEEDPLLVAWRDPEHPAHDRLLITPHSAFYCEEGVQEFRQKTSQMCRRALLDQPLYNIVN